LLAVTVRPPPSNLEKISPTFYEQFLSQYFCAKKLQSQNVTREKMRNLLQYEKFASKMLIKLTSGGNFTNILHAAFAQISFHQETTKTKL